MPTLNNENLRRIAETTREQGFAGSLPTKQGMEYLSYRADFGFPHSKSIHGNYLKPGRKGEKSRD